MSTPIQADPKIIEQLADLDVKQAKMEMDTYFAQVRRHPSPMGGIGLFSSDDDMGLNPQPLPPTDADLARLDAAAEKRRRKAAKRKGTE